MSFVIQRVTGRQISLSEIRTVVLRIGRGTNAELRSDNPAVALEHAVIEGDSAGYTITDRGSITGTYVNGRPVETARLAKSDVIEIGDLRIDVQVADPAKPLFLRIVTKPRRQVSNAAPIEEDDAAVPLAAEGSGVPIRPPKVDYAAAFRLQRPYLTKLGLIALGLIVALTVIGEVTRKENQTAFMPGGVTSAHARARDAKGESIAKDCEACHDPWNSVKDERCITCHQRVIHSDTETGTPACMTCHAEHRNLPKLALINDRSCTSCHEDLPANMKPEARASSRSSDPRYPLAVLKSITTFGVDHPELVLPDDPNNLRFNHKVHLKKGGIQNATGRKEELTCDGCHALTVTRGKSDPVTLSFEQHCQRCHKLTFDPRFPTAELPHGGDPQVVYGYVLNIYSGNQDIIGKSPDEVRRLLSRRATVAPSERAVINAEQVVKTKCAKCHEVRRAATRLVVDPPVIRSAWLPGSRFTHTAHRAIDCESCHKGARESVVTRDVLMPRRDDCTSCHGPKTAGSPAGAPASASSCVTCHEYHVRSKPLLGAVAAAGASSGGSGMPAFLGEDIRMIDTILLIAIALLLLVVLVPVSLALFQRLKPKPEERPMGGGAPRPAAPLPPPPGPAAPSRPAAPPSSAPAAAPLAPPSAPPPAADATRVGSMDEMQPGGKAGGSTEFVQWYGMLLCTSGELEGQRFVVEEEGLYIGRDAQLSQVVINDSRISKRHVRVFPKGGKVVAIDQGSTNGTFMGSAPAQRITEVALKRGDTLVLADNAATFVYQI